MTSPAPGKLEILFVSRDDISRLDISDGDVPGRERDDERILFWHRELATTDVALAALIYRRAVEQSLGTRIAYR